MKLKISITMVLCSVLCALCSNNAYAYEFSSGKSAFKLTAYGMVSMIEPDFEPPDFIGDWSVRAQYNYAIASNKTLGLMYAIDELAIYKTDWARDAFLFIEDKRLGRIEIGYTDSIATKLGVGLPDVGSLRINDNPLFYKKIHADGAVISNTTVNSDNKLRINVVSLPTNMVQFGASVSGLTTDYKYAADLGMKIRNPNGKTKTAFSFGLSFIDAPEDMRTDVFAPRVTADWRAQFSTGMNLQYNSWIFGVSARAIYDQDAIGVATDGISAGAGISYDILKYTLSASYLMSTTGIWNDKNDSYTIHTGIASFRYKYSENVTGWISLGISGDTPFVSAGLGAKF